MSVTIAGEPVLIDIDDQIQDWIDCYLDGILDDPFFAPQDSFSQSTSGSSHSNSFYFESALPPLPRIEISRLQWPAVGASRFARGLFVVDAHAMAKIALEAWGVVWNPLLLASPASWVPIQNNPVDVRVIESTNPLVDLTLKMFVLQPIRITDQCWLVRLVDLRYFKHSQTGPIMEASLPTVDKVPTALPEVGKLNVYPSPYGGGAPAVVEGGAYATGMRAPGSHRVKRVRSYVEVNDEWVEVTRDPDYAIRPTRSWLELCADLRVLGVDIGYVPDSLIQASLGVPDILYANSNASLLEMADSIAFSVGCRPVVQLRENANSPVSVKVQCQRVATAATIRENLFALAKVTGDDSNVKSSPKLINFITPSPWSYYSGEQKTYTKTNVLPGFGPSLECRSVMYFHWQLDSAHFHDKWEPQGIFDAYHNTIAATLSAVNGWNQSEHSICLPGIQEVILSGHDDFLEFDWSHNLPTTRVVSLPVSFFPKGLLAQHPVNDPVFSSGTLESDYPDCPWFCAPRSHIFGAATAASAAGEYITTKRAWKRQFVDVQIVDEALAIDGMTESKFRKVRVKALVCIDSALAFKESVKMYFGDQLVWNASSGEVERFTGWIVYGPKGSQSGRRHWLGTLTLGYNGFVGGFWVTPATALDGPLPVGNQWVQNIYKWDYGAIGAVVRVEQDGGRWIPLQQEYSCPPDEPTLEPLGSCNYYDPEVGSVCAIMTEAACALQSGGTWTEGGTCT